jgi:hypothetical protein
MSSAQGQSGLLRAAQEKHSMPRVPRHLYAAVGAYTVTVLIQDQGTTGTVMSTAQVR